MLRTEGLLRVPLVKDREMVIEKDETVVAVRVRVCQQQKGG